MLTPHSHADWQQRLRFRQTLAAVSQLCLALLVCSIVRLPPAAASPLLCSPYVPAVEQNCWLYLDSSLPQSLLTTAANPFTSRYDCALALGYYLPCVVDAANRSYDAIYSSLLRTPCLQGAGAATLVNHSAVLTVLQVDSLGQVGVQSDYKHGNGSLDGNVGCCDGSASNTAAAAVSFPGAACCNLDQGLQPLSQQLLSTLQAGIHKATYNLTAVNPTVPPSALQLQRRQTGQQRGQPASHSPLSVAAAVRCWLTPDSSLRPFCCSAAKSCLPTGELPAVLPVQVACNSSTLRALASAVNELCYFHPLYPLPSLGSLSRPLSRVSCALAFAEFSLCSVALNNASLKALQAAARTAPAGWPVVTAAGQWWRGLLHLPGHHLDAAGPTTGQLPR